MFLGFFKDIKEGDAAGDSSFAGRVTMLIVGECKVTIERREKGVEYKFHPELAKALSKDEWSHVGDGGGGDIRFGDGNQPLPSPGVWEFLPIPEVNKGIIQALPDIMRPAAHKGVGQLRGASRGVGMTLNGCIKFGEGGSVEEGWQYWLETLSYR